ncbi:MAG: sugar phosphate isomerase/epimerase [Clostridia bacterium]|nr:sugar phosphate isomerase/epimerase [Clostridia bacterium]
MSYFAFSTASLYPMEPEKAALAAFDAGYRDLEIFVNCEYEQTEEYIDLLNRLLDERGMRIHSFHPYMAGTEFFILFSEYDRRRREALAVYQRSIRAAAAMGAKYLILHGPGNRPTACREPLPHEIQVYKTLCDYGAQFGVEILQENVRNNLSRFPEFFTYLREAVPELGFNLDFKQALQAGFPLEDYISAMGDRIRNVHINDVDISGHCRLPGEGRLDYPYLFSLLDGVGYDGGLVTEVYRQDFENQAQIVTSRLFLEGELAKYQLSRKNPLDSFS